METLISHTADERSPEYQRLDHWMWCARLLKTRGACARHVAETGLRINRQVTAKAHAKLRPGDVLTFCIGRDGVRVVRVVALATRRGPASEACMLFEDIPDDTAAGPAAGLSPGGGGGICASLAGLGERALGTTA